jgi:hypothetical protein
MDKLKSGQSWNNEVKQEYDRARAEFGQGIWLILLTSAGDKKDWSEAEQMIGGWPVAHHPDLLRTAKDNWGPESGPNSVAPMIVACVKLMECFPKEDLVIRTPHVWAVLRSGFSDDAARMFDLVRKYSP